MTDRINPRQSPTPQVLPWEQSQAAADVPKAHAIKRKPVPSAGEPRGPQAPESVHAAPTAAAIEPPKKRRVLTKKRPPHASREHEAKSKSTIIATTFVRHDLPSASRPSWQNGKGPIASKDAVEAFLEQAEKLAPLIEKAKTRARIDMWASAAVGVAAGVGIGFGLAMLVGPVIGPAVGAFAGVLMAAMAFGLFKKLLPKHASAKIIKDNEAAFFASLGASLRAAFADPRLARELDQDKRWQQAIKQINAYYPKHRDMHPSLVRAFDPKLKPADKDFSMWATRRISKF